MLNINNYNLGYYMVPPTTAGGICIDIGANVGSFIQKYHDHFSTIYFYEPIELCYNKCMEFAKKYSHIHGHNLAVWSESNIEVNILQHQNNDSGSSAIESNILNEEWAHKNIIQKVRTISLTDILNSINKEIDYCKSDCETSEYFIFMNTDLSKIKYIGMEMHWQMGKSKQEELIDHMNKTHKIIVGKTKYTPYNREVLLERIAL